MTQPWHPEVVVRPALAGHLIAEQFPSLAPVKIESFGVGWDNIAFLINKRYVFRFPQRQLGAALIDTELKVMPHLAARLPARVPNPLFIGVPSESFAWSFSGYELIVGRTACSANLTTDQRLQLAIPLARFLKALHSIPSDEAARWGCAPDPLGRFDIPRRTKMARERIAYIREQRLFGDIEKLLSIIESAPLDFAPRSDVLEHGDLYARHLVVDEVSALAGVIDWGDVHLGDSASDLMIVYTLLPLEAREQFLDVYGHVPQVTLTMARFRATSHTAALVYYAHQTGDADLFRESLIALNHIVGD